MIHTDILHGTEITRVELPGVRLSLLPLLPLLRPRREINWPGKLQLITHGRDEIAPTLRSRCFPDYHSSHAIPLPRKTEITEEVLLRVAG